MLTIDLSKQVIIVTGAESGIGRSIALACSNAGAAVCIAGLVVDGLEETMSLGAAQGHGDLFACPTDIRDPDALDRLFIACRERFGVLTGVVANAGVLPAIKPVHQVTLEEWNHMISVNLTGTFLTVSTAARYLLQQGTGGSIIATGSSTAIRPIAGTVPYVASKGGVHALMLALALELGPFGIRVNTLVPGQTDTPPLRAIPGYIEQASRALPLGSVAQPEEIGRYVAFALSEAVPHLTGALLKVDSGRTIG